MEIIVKDISLREKVKSKSVNENSIELKSNFDAALIKPNEIALIPTGLIMKIPEGLDIHLSGTKSFSVNKGLLIIDTFDHQNMYCETELLVPVINLSGKNQVVMRNEIIACLRLIPLEKIRFVQS